jgi:hypothetical protein
VTFTIIYHVTAAKVSGGVQKKFALAWNKSDGRKENVFGNIVPKNKGNTAVNKIVD